jgi:hypothetical protein
LLYLNARDEQSLPILANKVVPSLLGKQKALAQNISNAEDKQLHVSPKVIAFWSKKKVAAEFWLDVLQNASQSDTEIDADSKARRSGFFGEARNAWEVGLCNILTKLSREIIGPYALGMCGHENVYIVADWL